MNPQSSQGTWHTVAIVGVGLIGGSVGLALRRRALARHVVGIGRRPETLRIAAQRGAITTSTTEIASGVRDAELIVVCTPVAHIVEHVREASHACAAQALITDVGSTKAGICHALAETPEGNGVFVGSHPMAGSEKSGPEHARSDLFEGTLTVVTPTEGNDQRHVDRVEQFWQSLGSRVVRTSPDEHDRAVAAVSHLPHVVAAVLSATTPEADLSFAGRGWRDTTRVAAGDAALWQQILVENRSHILKSLDGFEKLLATFRDALAADDRRQLLRVLEAGKHHRELMGS